LLSWEPLSHLRGGQGHLQGLLVSWTFGGTILFIDDVLRFALASALKDSSQRYRVIYE